MNVLNVDHLNVFIILYGRWYSWIRDTYQGNMTFLLNFVVFSLAASVCVQAEGETELIHIPPYSLFLEDTFVANVVLRHDLKPAKQKTLEVLKVYIAVIDLADQVAEKGENAYSEFYTETVENALKQVIDSPVDAYDKLWKGVNNTNTELVKILSYVLYTQLSECELPITYECDKIIASGLDNDPDLALRADLLVAGGRQGKLFLDLSNLIRTEYSENFDAEEFLVTSSDVMKPLVLAAYETQKVVKSLQL